jgi:hypothetical protein
MTNADTEDGARKPSVPRHGEMSSLRSCDADFSSLHIVKVSNNPKFDPNNMDPSFPEQTENEAKPF